MKIENTQINYDIDKLLNTYFVALILIVVNIILYLKFGEKFGDIFIDVSREVTVPLRILDGQILYKDFHYEYGPFVPYFFSIICKLFGSDLDSFRLTGLTIATLISILIFKFSSLYICRKFALLSSLTFVFIFAFHSVGVNIFNYIFPYSYSSIFGVLFLLFLFYKTHSYYVLGKKTELISIAIVFSICMLTKLEIIFSTVILAFMYLFICRENNIFFNLKKNGLNTSKNYYYFSISIFSIPLILIYIYYHEIINYINNEIIYLVKQNLNNPIGRGALGIDYIYPHLIRSVKSFSFFIIYGGIFLCLDKNTSKNNSFKYFRLFLFFIALIASSFYVYAYGYNYLYLGTSLFLLLLVFFLSSIIYYRHGSKSKKEKLLLISVLSSLALTSRMAFNNTVEFYGFYLLAPASVCILIAIFYYVPLFARYKFKKRTNLFKSAFTVFFVIMCFSAYSNTSIVAANKNKLLKTDKGLLYVYEYQYFSVNSIINDFKGKLDDGDTILVLPEGYMLNYFLGVTPTSFNNSHIPDLVEGEREQKIIDEIKLKKYDYVIIVPRYTEEWGLPVLGVDYLQNTVKYIYKNYDPILLYGDLPFSDYNNFGILVLKLK
jgi:hypothetical protein